jgi:hypothetical protein
MLSLSASNDYAIHQLAKCIQYPTHRVHMQCQIRPRSRLRQRPHPRPLLPLPPQLRRLQPRTAPKLCGDQTQDPHQTDLLTVRTGAGTGRVHGRLSHPQQVVTQHSFSNVFEFKPGARWGSGNKNQKLDSTEQDLSA